MNPIVTNIFVPFLRGCLSKTLQGVSLARTLKIRTHGFGPRTEKCNFNRLEWDLSATALGKTKGKCKHQCVGTSVVYWLIIWSIVSTAVAYGLHFQRESHGNTTSRDIFVTCAPSYHSAYPVKHRFTLFENPKLPIKRNTLYVS